MIDVTQMSGDDLIRAYEAASEQWAAAQALKTRKDALRDELLRRYDAVNSLRAGASDPEASMTERYTVGPYILKFTARRRYYACQHGLFRALQKIHTRGFDTAVHASIEPKWSERLTWDSEVEEAFRPAIVGVGVSHVAARLTLR